MNLQHKQQHDPAPEMSYWQIHIGWVYITDMNSDSGSVFISIKNRIPSWKHEKLRGGGWAPVSEKQASFSSPNNALIQKFDTGSRIMFILMMIHLEKVQPYPLLMFFSLIHTFVCVCVCLCYIWLIRGLGCRVLGWRGPIILFLVFCHVYIVITEDSHTKHG